MRTPNKNEILEILILQHTDNLGFGESCEIVFDRELENEEITFVSDAIHKLRSVLPPVNKRTRRFEQESGLTAEMTRRRNGQPRLKSLSAARVH